jgi:hypothetical protein
MTPPSSRWLAFALLPLCCWGLTGCGVHAGTPEAAAQTSTSGETIVLFRHGEKPADGLGQLTCMGLNRALALPKVLLSRFSTPSAIYAPNPANQISEDGQTYSYVRPLATVEPTAIQLGLPVDTQLSYQDIKDLQTDVTAPAYANSTIFIAWEHVEAYDFAQQMLRTYGLDPSVVPAWSDSNYEMIYVFHITPPGTGSAAPGLSFTVQQEGLESSLTNTCPGQ